MAYNTSGLALNLLHSHKSGVSIGGVTERNTQISGQEHLHIPEGSNQQNIYTTVTLKATRDRCVLFNDAAN